MNFDEQKLKRLDNIRLNDNQYENVIRFPDQNTLSTRINQIRNPQKEISGGFLCYYFNSITPIEAVFSKKRKSLFLLNIKSLTLSVTLTLEIFSMSSLSSRLKK